MSIIQIIVAVIVLMLSGLFGWQKIKSERLEKKLDEQVAKTKRAETQVKIHDTAEKVKQEIIVSQKENGAESEQTKEAIMEASKEPDTDEKSKKQETVIRDINGRFARRN